VFNGIPIHGAHFPNTAYSHNGLLCSSFRTTIFFFILKQPWRSRSDLWICIFQGRYAKFFHRFPFYPGLHSRG